MSLDEAGGEERVCLLDHEDTLVPGTMRATGDWVDVRDAQLRFLGRRDRLIKRHGKRVNLDSLQQVGVFGCCWLHGMSYSIGQTKNTAQDRMS